MQGACEAGPVKSVPIPPLQTLPNGKSTWVHVRGPVGTHSSEMKGAESSVSLTGAESHSSFISRTEVHGRSQGYQWEAILCSSLQKTALGHSRE